MILGTKLTVNTSFWHPVSSGTSNLQAVYYEAFSVVPAGFVTRLGGRVRSLSGTPLIYFGIYQRLENGQPGLLLGRTGPLGVTALGGNVEGPIVWAESNQHSQSVVTLGPGSRFLLGYIVQGGTVEFSVVSPEQALIYFDDAPVGPPSQVFDVASSGLYPTLALYADFSENEAPTASLTSPANGAALNTLTPTFTGLFSDANAVAPINDRLSAYTLEVSHNGEVIWGGAGATFLANVTERQTKTFNRGYLGPTLVAGNTYSWRAQVADVAGVFSDWTAPRTFQINAQGIVTPTSPAEDAKIETSPAALTWSGQWHQPQGHAASQVAVRILTPSGAVYKTSPVIAKAVASSALPGTAFTISAAQAALGTLVPGSYSYQIAGYDPTNATWSPWSDPVAFRINAAPTVPSNLQPPDGAVVSSYPLLEFNSLDPDLDDVEGVDVLWDIEITRPNGSVITVSASDYDADTGIGSLQLTSTEVSIDGVYTWRVQGKDTSAGTLGLSGWSKTQRFTFVAGPAVTITNPTEDEVVDTVTPLITFALSGGGTLARFRPYFYLRDVVTPLWAPQGEIVSTLGEYRVPAGVLKNKTWYEVLVRAWDNFNVAGTSLRREFYVDYSNPETLVNPVASPYRYPTDPTDTSILLSWQMSTYPVGEFAGYGVYRRLASELPTERRLLRRLTNIQQTNWVDPHAPSSRPIIYEVTQFRRLGNVVLESEPVVITTQLNLKAGVIASVQDPSKRIVLWWRHAGEWPTRDTNLDREESEKMTWGSNNRPLIFRGVGDRRVKQVSARLRDDMYGTRFQYRDMLTDLWRGTVQGLPSSASAAGVVSYRDDDERIFGILSNLRFTGEKNSIVANFQVRETDFLDGVLDPS